MKTIGFECLLSPKNLSFVRINESVCVEDRVHVERNFWERGVEAGQRTDCKGLTGFEKDGREEGGREEERRIRRAFPKKWICPVVSRNVCAFLLLCFQSPSLPKLFLGLLWPTRPRSWQGLTLRFSSGRTDGHVPSVSFPSP